MHVLPLGSGSCLARSDHVAGQRSHVLTGLAGPFQNKILRSQCLRRSPARHPVLPGSSRHGVLRARLRARDQDGELLIDLKKTVRQRFFVTPAAKAGAISTASDDEKDRAGQQAGVSGRDEDSKESSSGIDLSAVVRSPKIETFSTDCCLSG